MTNQKQVVPLKEPLKTVELDIFLDKYLGKGIKPNFTAPPEFQRPIAWKSSDRTAYFKSILLDRSEGIYVLVDVEFCKERLEDSTDTAILKKLEETEYLKSIDSRYIVLDGNNRMDFLRLLLSDEWQIPEGEYEYLANPTDGAIKTFTVRKRSQKFSDLPSRVRIAFLSRNAHVSSYTQIDREGMSKIFANINSGIPLNGQELRNAFFCEWADYVRKLSSELGPLLQRLFKNYKQRLKGDEFIVDCLDYALNNNNTTKTRLNTDVYPGVSPKTRDKLYKSDFLDSSDYQKYWSKFVELMDFVDRLVDDGVIDVKAKQKADKLIRQSLIINLFWLMCNRDITTYHEASLAVECHEHYYNNCKDTFGPEDKTFKDSCGGLSSENIKARQMVLEKVALEVKHGMISQVEYPDSLDGTFNT